MSCFTTDDRWSIWFSSSVIWHKTVGFWKKSAEGIKITRQASDSSLADKKHVKTGLLTNMGQRSAGARAHTRTHTHTRRVVTAVNSLWNVPFLIHASFSPLTHTHTTKNLFSLRDAAGSSFFTFSSMNLDVSNDEYHYNINAELIPSWMDL